jgi:hypothetical protein
MTKLSVLFILTLGLAAFTALAAPFSSPQNVVVLRAGTASTGSQGFLDEYTPAGVLVQTITLPTTTATTPATGSGTSIVFGQTTALIHETSLSDDGAFVVIPGYAACGASTVENTTSANNQRVIATVDYLGNYTLANSNPTWASATSGVRGCASDGFGNFWGDWTGGVSYLGNNNPYAGQITGGWRASAVINGTICFTSTLGVRYFDGFPLPSLPTTGINLSANTYILQSALSGTAYSSAGFAIPKAPLTPYVAATQGSVAYIANYNSTALWITPFTWNGGSWDKQGDMTMTYGAATAHPLWLAVDYSGAQPIVYFTTTVSGKGVYKFTDTSVTGTMLWGTTVTAASLFTPTAGFNYRGITMAPTQPAAPVFTAMPVNTTAFYGGTATFTAAATGANPYKWVWKAGSTILTNGNNGRASTVSGATTDTLTITGVTHSDDSTSAGSYRAIASNNNGTPVTSDPATLTLQGPCFTPPVSITNVAGTIANFTVNASGCAQPVQSISWDLNGSYFGDGPTGTGSIIAGSGTTSLYITNVGDLDAGTYTIHLYDNNSALSVASASLTVLDPPGISQQPGNQNKVVGTTATFTVSATGGSLHYEWFKSPSITLTNGPSPTGAGATVSGATSSQLVIANVQSGDAGSYFVTVTNLAGSTNSDPASLTVGVLPVVSDMSDQTNVVGTTAGFSATVTAGTAPLTNTWKHNGTVIGNDGHFSGTDTTALGIANVTTDDHRLYQLTVANAFGSTTVSANLWVITDTNKPNDVADLIIYDPFDYPIGPSPAVSFYSWENIISVYNRITGEPAYWVNTGNGLYTAVVAWDPTQLYGGICRNGGGYNFAGIYDGVSGRFPYPGLDCAFRNKWAFSSSGCNNHLHFGGVSSGSVYFSLIFFGDQGSGVLGGTLDITAGFTSGNSTGGGANADTFAYGLGLKADVSPGNQNTGLPVDGPGGWWFGVFKGGGDNPGANGQWTTNYCWRGHPYLIVGCYKIVSGGTTTNDDIVSLWVEPPHSSFGADEAHVPPPDAGGMQTTWGVNAPITEFAVRAGLNAQPFSKAISDLRIGTTWASVTKPYRPTLTQTYSAGSVTLSWPAKDSPYSTAVSPYTNGYKLQVSSDLLNLTNWDTTTVGLDGSGNTRLVTETPATNEFWRLDYPPRSGAYLTY